LAVKFCLFPKAHQSVFYLIYYLTGETLAEHLPTLAVITRSTLRAAISPGDSLILAPTVSKLQQGFNITFPENSSDSLHLCDKEERDSAREKNMNQG